jgi:hypothetical protein
MCNVFGLFVACDHRGVRKSAPSVISKSTGRTVHLIDCVSARKDGGKNTCQYTQALYTSRITESYDLYSSLGLLDAPSPSILVFSAY